MTHAASRRMNLPRTAPTLPRTMPTMLRTAPTLPRTMPIVFRTAPTLPRTMPIVFRALLFLAATAGAPSLAAAQDPVPRPTPRDTLRVPTDTLRADTLPIREDTLPELNPDTVIVPAVQFPAMPLSPDVFAAGTEWVWDRETLLREAHVSLTDLLERIPGVATFRAGTFVQPEAAAGFGGTAARTEIVIDGYVMDPLTGSTFDLSQLALGHLREVRVQRRLGLLRILITTEYPVEGQAYTRIEAGIGVPAANLFRGVFLVPHVIIGPLALGIERLDADGIRRAEPAGLFSGWAKWAWTNGTRGVQLEWMRGTLRRQPNSPWLVDRMRQEFILRVRNEFTPGLVGEVYAGRSQTEETIPGPDEATADIRTDRSLIQAGARLGWQLPWVDFGAAARYRSLDNLPVGEASFDAGASLGPLRLGGEAAIASWDGNTSTWTNARATVGTGFGASAFGEVTRGSRGAPAFDDTTGPGILITDRSGWRAGVSLDLGRAAGTVAFVSLDQDFAWPFGLPFDRGATPLTAGSARGIEAHGRVVIWPSFLTLSSWITDWQETDNWSYLPSRSWRTALELHTVPLASGNLEIFGRAEANMRGSVVAWDPAPAAGTAGYVTLPAFTTADAYLQIRIIDVRIFIRWEDLLANDIEDLPQRIYRGQRLFYGVKWNLWN